MNSIQLKVAEVLEKGKLENIMSTSAQAIVILNKSGLEKKDKFEYAWILQQIDNWETAMFRVRDSINNVLPLGSSERIGI